MGCTGSGLCASTIARCLVSKTSGQVARIGRLWETWQRGIWLGIGWGFCASNHLNVELGRFVSRGRMIWLMDLIIIKFTKNPMVFGISKLTRLRFQEWRLWHGACCQHLEICHRCFAAHGILEGIAMLPSGRFPIVAVSAGHPVFRANWWQLHLLLIQIFCDKLHLSFQFF